MKKLIFTLFLSIAAVPGLYAAPSILSLKHSITDNAIVYPESFETDTHKMMQNWYLQNYTVLTASPSDTPRQTESDAAYIKRLSEMPTEIEMPYNQIVRSYIDMYTQRRRQLVENMLGMSLYYMPIFEQALERKGLPLELRYLPVIESALNPDAVSRAGATGIWQMMLPTARGLGLEINTLVDERRDPYASSEAAATYLKQLYSMYNDWSLAIAAYNCGPGNVNKALRRAGVEGKNTGKDFWSIYYFLPQETRGYVPAFIAANYVMTYYNQHGISPALARRPLVTDSVHVTKRVHLQQIADVLNLPIEEIRVLNPQYRRDIIPGDVRPYSLVLPSMGVYSYIMSEDSIITHDSRLYARRATVQPTEMSEYDNNGDYTTQLIVKKHKVRKGETLSKIARKYGVTVADIKKWNKLKSNSISRGRVLTINTYQRVAVPKPIDSDTQVAASATPADSVPALASAETEAAPSIEAQTSAEDAAPAAPATPAKKKANTAPARSKKKTTNSGSYTTHTVRKGESLYSIAKAKGVTVAQIQQANGISGSNIRAGQKLKIPRS